MKSDAQKIVRQLGTDKANMSAEIKALRGLLESARVMLILGAKHCPDESGIVRDRGGNEVASYRGLKSTMLAIAEKVATLTKFDYDKAKIGSSREVTAAFNQKH